MLLSRLLFVRRVLALLVFAVSASLLPAVASAADYVSISASTANIRAEPTTKSEVLWQLTAGYPLVVQQRKGKWLKVRDFETTLGWVFSSLVNRVPHRVVTSNTLNVRAGPGTNRKVVGKLQRYDVVRSIGQKGTWAHVREADGRTGWVAKRLTWGW